MAFYLFFQLIIILSVVVGVSSIILCVQRKQYPFFILISIALIPYFQYQFFNPVYNGPLFTQLSDSRLPIYDEKIRNWGDTFLCHPNQIYYPVDNEEISKIVLNSTKIRVVGGGHSFSPLACTGETLVSLSKMAHVLSNTTNTIRAQAGITIETLLVHLLQHDKIIHGFGSIQEQTLAGAFSTSHHGLTFHSFAEEVTSITVILANGTIIHTNDLFYWRSSLGMLGIISEVTIKTHPNVYVDITSSKMNIDDAIETLITADAGIIETNYNQKETGLLKHIRFRDGHGDIDYPVKTNHFISAVWDSIIIPLTVLVPSLSTFPLLDFASNSTSTNVPIVEAWSHHAEYGMQYSAYAIPYENCSKFIKSIDDRNNHSISTILIRYVPSQINTTCLTIATENSCVIDVYDLQVQGTMIDYHIELEKNVSELGGSSHWGKFYVGDISLQLKNMPCYESFLKIREELDPSSKFLNEYTQEIVTLNSSTYENRYLGESQRKYEDKAMSFRIVFCFTVVAYIVTFVFFAREKNGYERLK